MFTIPLGYNKTGYELLHAYQRYVRRKSEFKEYSVRDTIQTFEKFLEVELAVERKIQQMEDSARQARSSGQGHDSQ